MTNINTYINIIIKFMVLLGTINYYEVKMIDNYYNVEEASKILRVKRLTVRRWCKSGLLEARKIGKQWLIREDELNLYNNDNMSRRDKK